jgi:hypothetical protein
MSAVRLALVSERIADHCETAAMGHKATKRCNRTGFAMAWPDALVAQLASTVYGCTVLL